MSAYSDRSALTPPPLGESYLDPKRTCTRLLGFAADGTERLCDRPAVYHIDWGEWCGFCCPEHKAEADERWSSEGGHNLGPCCGMPGAGWFTLPDGSSFCGYDEKGLPTVEDARRMRSEMLDAWAPPNLLPEPSSARGRVVEGELL